MDNKPLSSRVALVTGASRGLGTGIALELAAQGAAVAVNYFANPEKAHRVVDEIRRAGGRAESFPGDVRDEAQVRALVESVAAKLGPVDVLVPNATGPQPMLPIEEISWRICLDQLEFFVKSPLILAQAVIGPMKKRRFGRIIHIGSEVVALGNSNFSSYVAAKGAQLGLTRSWARELAPWGITVNLVAPGWVPTERHADVPQADLDGYAKNVPLKRHGTPKEIGQAVAYLASDAGAFVTGQRISVNGGNTME
jgi:3-oxoacyl-[acyl-carrier protein] reductase